MGRVRKRHAAMGIAVVAAALVAPASASAITITIGDDNQYAPSSVTQDLGAGSFDWEWGPGGVGNVEEHNVLQDAGLFGSGEPTLDRPGGYSVTASAGSYPYFCEIHVGMVGEVSVRPVTASSRGGGGGVRVAWADAATTTGSKYDVRYKAGKKKWKLWRKKTSKQAGTFGRKGKPAKLRKRVKLQARSRAGKAKSDWSPTLKLKR